MFDGADDGGWEHRPLKGRRAASRGRWWASLPVRLGLAAGALVLAYGLARAQVTQLNNCSQSVGATAAAVPFPASGSTGSPLPLSYLLICNAHATQTLGVNFVGGTAAIGSAGTVTLAAGACREWAASAIPSALSVIGSGSSTTTACGYH